MAVSFDEIMGRSVLVVIKTLDRNKKELSRREFLGEVVEASIEYGIVIRDRATGEKSAYPPELNNFIPARPGLYTLQPSGISVMNPDYTAVWKIYPKNK